MDGMAAVCGLRVGCRVGPPRGAYPGMTRLPIVMVVLLLGIYLLPPGRSVARAGNSDRSHQPIADHARQFARPAEGAAPGSGGLPPATSTSRHTLLAHAPSAPTLDLPASLSTALAFNIFIIGDLSQRQSITFGRVAVGGNATLERYRIGDTLPRARDNRADLIVAGTLVFTNGLVAKGGIIAGGKASLTGVGIPHGRLGEGQPIDFGAHGASLKQIAASLGQLPANGITQLRTRPNKRTQITLLGVDPQVNVFTLAGSDLAAAQTLIISVPRAATVLVNIDGEAERIQNIGFAIGTVSRQRILYNFYQATELILDDDRIQGSILAPQARITFVKGRVNGTLIGGALTGTGVAWPDPFIGHLPPLPGD
jgi:choice-of-anchor A domain-containing protein